MKISTPHAGWSWVRLERHDDQRLVTSAHALMRDLAEMPGVKFFEPENGAPASIELPQNTWCLPEARELARLAGRTFDADRFAPAIPPRELYAHQQRTVERVVHEGHGVIAHPMGLGKLQPVTERVLTPTGWRPIGALRVGDEVIGSTGAPTKVIGVFPQGVQPIYRVWFSDDSSTLAGDEHLWALRTKHGREVVVTTRELRCGETIEAPVCVRDGRKPYTTRINLSRAAWYLPMLTAPAQFAPTELPLPGYLVGVLLANGWLGERTQLTINAQDVDQVRAQIPEKFWGHVAQASGCVRVGIKGVGSATRALGMHTRAAQKCIPAVYKVASVAERVALLRGLMDCDGSISVARNKVTYHTTSQQLAQDVRELVEGLGGIASVREYARETEGKPTEYHVRIRTPRDLAPFSVQRKLARWRPGTHANPCRTFVRAEYVGDMEAVCIRVAAADQLYATEHAILTHNTSCALVSALTLREDGPTVIVAPRFTRETWKRELARLGLQDEGFFAATGVKADVAVPRDTRWIFIHYEVLDAWGHVLRWVRPRARVTIYDEAHWLKNATSKRGKAAHAVRTPHAICLTGTPLANRPSELWSLLALASGPSAWGSFFDFRQRYCGAYRDNYGWRDGQPTFVEELRDRLSRVYTRYELDEVGIELPPLRRQKIEVPADASDDELLGGVRLERVYESLLSGSFRDDTLKTLTRLRKASSRAKVPATADAVSSMLEQGESVLLFCWERAMVDALGKAIRRRVAGADVHTHWGGLGSMGDLAVQAWQDARVTGAPSVLISTLDALKEGVTLTRARHVVLHDLSWVPTDVLQAEARVHRIGQHVPCTSTWVALEGGIDPIILRAFAQKAHAQKETLGFGATRAALQELGVTPADDDGFAWLAEHAAELAKKLEASS